jgi:hypothetical protein
MGTIEKAAETVASEVRRDRPALSGILCAIGPDSFGCF